MFGSTLRSLMTNVASITESWAVEEEQTNRVENNSIEVKDSIPKIALGPNFNRVLDFFVGVSNS